MLQISKGFSVLCSYLARSRAGACVLGSWITGAIGGVLAFL